MRSYLGRARYSKIDQPPLNPPGATIHRPGQESCGHFASTFRHCHRNQSSPVAPSCTVFGVLFRRAGSFLPARPGIAPSSLIYYQYRRGTCSLFAQAPSTWTFQMDSACEGWEEALLVQNRQQKGKQLYKLPRMPTSRPVCWTSLSL